MAESFQEYIKIRTFLGYRPKEIHVELQNAFGKHDRRSDEAPTYGAIQRWSKRFRDAVDSPLGSQSKGNIDEKFSTDDIDGQSSNVLVHPSINFNANPSGLIGTEIEFQTKRSV